MNKHNSFGQRLELIMLCRGARLHFDFLIYRYMGKGRKGKTNWSAERSVNKNHFSRRMIAEG